MANNNLIGYQTGALGIPGLSIQEYVRAPRARDTRVATAPKDTSPNPWDTLSKTLASAVNVVNDSYAYSTAVTKLEKSKTPKVIKIDNTDKYKEEVAAEYLKFTNKIQLNNGGLDYDKNGNIIELETTTKLSSKDMLVQYGTKIEELKSQYKGNEDILAYIDKISTKDMKALVKKTAEEHILDVRDKKQKALTAKLTLDLKSGMSINDIVGDSKESVNTLVTTGKKTTAYTELATVIDDYKYNNSVIQSRYKEAMGIYNEYTSQGKQLPEGFMEYYGKLSQHKAELDRKTTKKSSERKAEDIKKAKEYLKLLDGNRAEFPPAALNLANYTQANFSDTLNDVKTALYGGEYFKLLKQAGYEGQELEDKLNKHVGKVVSDYALDLLVDTKGSVPNAKLMSPVMNETIKTYTESATREALEAGKFGTINSLYQANPDVVKPIIKGFFNSSLTTVLKASPDNYESIKASLLTTLNNFDSELLHSTLDTKQKFYIDLLSKLSQEEALATINKIRTSKIDIATTGDLTKEETAYIDALPFSDRKEIREDLLLRKTAFGYVDLEEYDKNIEHRRFNGSMLTDDLAQMFINAPDEKEANPRKVLFKVLSKYSTTGDIPEGSHLEIVNGNIRISNNTGAIIAVKHIDTIQQEVVSEQTRLHNEELWNKSHGRGGIWDWFTATYTLKSGGFIRKGEETNPYSEK